MKFLKFIVLTLLAVLSLQSWSAPSILLPDDEFDLQITPYLSVLEDPSGTLGIDDILQQKYQLKFSPSHSDYLRFSLSESNYWLRFSVTNPHKEKQHLVLSIANNRLDKIDFFQYSEGNIEHRSSGQDIHARPKGSHLQAYPFLLEIDGKQSQTYFICISSDSVINTQLHLKSSTQFLTSQYIDNTVLGISLGWLIATAAFFFLIWYQLRLPFALYSGFYTLSIFIFIPSWLGQIPESLIASTRFKELLIIISIMASAILQAKLIRSLQWQKAIIGRSLDTLSIILSLLGAALLFLSSGSAEIALGIIIIGCNIIFMAILSTQKSQHEQAQTLIALGHLIVAIGVLAAMLTAHNFLAMDFINDWAPVLLPLSLICCMVFAVIQVLRSSNSIKSKNTKDSDLILPELLSKLGHEFRTPINGVLGMSELLSDTHLTHTQRDYLETISLSGRDLLHLVSEMSDFAKLQSGRISLDHRAFDLTECLSQCMARYQQEASRKKVELVLNIADELAPRILGDKNRIQTIVSNLIAHSMQHTENGELELKAFKLNSGASKGIFFQLQLKGSLIEHSELRQLFRNMTDNSGIQPPLDIDQGLGLVIVRRLVALMQGSIEVENLTIHGSSITLFLPLLEEVTTQSEDNSDLLAGQRILIVDDNATFRTVIEKHVKRWGMRADSTYSGKEALALMRNKCNLGEPYDYIVIDHDMPIMNGIQLTERLMADDDISPKPTRIMLTGLSIGAANQEAKEAGIEKIINKPISGRALKSVLLEFQNLVKSFPMS